MTETIRTNRFILLFFLYYFAASLGMAMIPAFHTLPDSFFMAIAQTVCFLPPILFYFFYTKKPLKETLHLQPLNWKNILLVILFAFAIQPFMSLLSFLSALFFPNPVQESIEGIHQSGFAISLLAVAVLPAILEEISMRGILLSGYQFLGKWKAAFASALLFGLFHGSPQQLPYAFCVGFIFCFLVERTGSILASILPHLVINGTTVFSIFFTPVATANTLPEEASNAAILFSLGVMVFLSIPLLTYLLYWFLKINPPKEDLQLLDEYGTPYQERFFTPSIGVFLLLYLAFILIPIFIH